jgi:hypothetical protein
VVVRGRDRRLLEGTAAMGKDKTAFQPMFGMIGELWVSIEKELWEG